MAPACLDPERHHFATRTSLCTGYKSSATGSLIVRWLTEVVMDKENHQPDHECSCS